MLLDDWKIPYGKEATPSINGVVMKGFLVIYYYATNRHDQFRIHNTALICVME
jgi:hypothetical protein